MQQNHLGWLLDMQAPGSHLSSTEAKSDNQGIFIFPASSLGDFSNFTNKMHMDHFIKIHTLLLWLWGEWNSALLKDSQVITRLFVWGPHFGKILNNSLLLLLKSKRTEKSQIILMQMNFKILQCAERRIQTA